MKPHAIVPVVFLSLLWSASNAVASNKHPLEGCYSTVTRDGEEVYVLIALNVRGKMYLIPTDLMPVNGLAGGRSGRTFRDVYAGILKEASQTTN